MASNPPKASGAFRTIGELSADTGIATHVLRYWETRFPQLRPLTRAGNRRYYRPEDVVLVRRIDTLLNRDGYTVRGVQQLLGSKVAEPVGSMPLVAAPPARSAPAGSAPAIDTALRSIRDRLAAALAADG